MAWLTCWLWGYLERGSASKYKKFCEILMVDKVTAGIKHLIPLEIYNKAKVSWASMKYFYGAFELCIVFSKIVSLLPFMAGSSDTQKIYPSKKTSCRPENYPECRWAVFKQLLRNGQSPTSFWWITINVSQNSIFHNLSLECVKLDFRGRFFEKNKLLFLVSHLTKFYLRALLNGWAIVLQSFWAMGIMITFVTHE